MLLFFLKTTICRLCKDRSMGKTFISNKTVDKILEDENKF